MSGWRDSHGTIAFRERFGDVEVELYYAALEDGRAQFEAVS
jgi:hypothetical protein